MIYLHLSSSVFWALRAPTVGDRKGDDCRNKVGPWYQPVDFQGYPGHHQVPQTRHQDWGDCPGDQEAPEKLCFRMEAEPVLQDSQSEGSNVSTQQLPIFVKHNKILFNYENHWNLGLVLLLLQLLKTRVKRPEFGHSDNRTLIASPGGGNSYCCHGLWSSLWGLLLHQPS